LLKGRRPTGAPSTARELLALRPVAFLSSDSPYSTLASRLSAVRASSRMQDVWLVRSRIWLVAAGSGQPCPLQREQWTPRIRAHRCCNYGNERCRNGTVTPADVLRPGNTDLECLLIDDVNVRWERARWGQCTRRLGQLAREPGGQVDSRWAPAYLTTGSATTVARAECSRVMCVVTIKLAFS